ncbi:MAG: hypothetical protein Fur0010_00610 [Bdellovibrio sp.]
MSTIDPNVNRSNFFPSSKPKSTADSNSILESKLQRNTPERVNMLQKSTAKDARVDIDLATKDFARIKKAVDAAPEVDNSDKISKLKSQIANGTYNIDYDALADKIISEGF